MAKSETGVQLLARLGSKPSLKGLEHTILPGGLAPRQIVELYGESNTGKSQFLLQLTANCILPREWKGSLLGGLGIGIIFIDTDYHFSLIRLIGILECRVYHACRQGETDTDLHMTDDEVEEIITHSLERLYLTKCSSSSQLVVTLQSLEGVLSNRPEICIIMIDSISAYYWIDKLAGGDSISIQEQNIRRVSDVITKLVSTYNLVVFVTKALIFQKNDKRTYTKQPVQCEHNEYLSKSWQKIVSQRFIFSKEGQTVSCGESGQILTNFNISWCDEKDTVHKRNFKVDSMGITFVK